MGLSGLASRAAELPRFGPKTARSGPNAATRLLGTEGGPGKAETAAQGGHTAEFQGQRRPAAGPVPFRAERPP